MILIVIAIFHVGFWRSPGVIPRSSRVLKDLEGGWKSDVCYEEICTRDVAAAWKKLFYYTINQMRRGMKANKFGVNKATDV